MMSERQYFIVVRSVKSRKLVAYEETQFLAQQAGIEYKGSPVGCFALNKTEAIKRVQEHKK